MENVYIVSAETGMYEERDKQILGVFSSMEKAEAYKVKITTPKRIPDNARELYSQYAHNEATERFNQNKLRIESAQKRLDEILAERANIQKNLQKALDTNNQQKIATLSKRYADFGQTSEKVCRMTLETGDMSYQEFLERVLSYDTWVSQNYSSDYTSDEIDIIEFRVDTNV